MNKILSRTLAVAALAGAAIFTPTGPAFADDNPGWNLIGENLALVNLLSQNQAINDGNNNNVNNHSNGSNNHNQQNNSDNSEIDLLSEWDILNHLTVNN
ncbi:hypothetical protein [Streptomyces sp. NPDC050504]|uniref:hypothetical protein n=1 Tax=Streptomyces sp. NPDC050504 TaxID=3365618 RepID=UPI0037AED53E